MHHEEVGHAMPAWLGKIEISGVLRYAEFIAVQRSKTRQDENRFTFARYFAADRLFARAALPFANLLSPVKH
jgi:hypothetical protein